MSILANPIVQMTLALAATLGGAGFITLLIANHSLVRDERRARGR